MMLKSFLVSCFSPTIMHPSHKAPGIPTVLPIYLWFCKNKLCLRSWCHFNLDAEYVCWRGSSIHRLTQHSISFSQSWELPKALQCYSHSKGIQQHCKKNRVACFNWAWLPQLQLESISRQVYVPCFRDTLLTSMGMFGGKQGDNCWQEFNSFVKLLVTNRHTVSF